MLFYELRDYPDDLPSATRPTMPQAERAAIARSKRIQDRVLVYRVTDQGETYMGSVWE